jgi:hypothetical protein
MSVGAAGRQPESAPMSKQIILDADYKPSDDEPFMNDRQREYFRGKLMAWKDEILKEARETLVTLQSESENHPDIADRASSETDRAIELRAPRPPAQADRQDRRRHRPHRRQHLWLLRGDRRADLAEAAGGPADRDALARSPGAPRAQRARLPRRLRPLPRSPPPSPARQERGFFAGEESRQPSSVNDHRVSATAMSMKARTLAESRRCVG